MMRRVLSLIVLFIAGCDLIPTPDDFPPPPPMTPIVEWPQVTATATIEPNLRPILPDDMQDAETFFLILITKMTAGDDVGIAELVKYPIRVRMDGREIMLNDQSEFLGVYESIFDEDLTEALSAMDDSDLTLMPNGVRVWNGEMWFNYFCVDLTCADAEFLITQINH